jgi:hypothetical protein
MTATLAAAGEHGVTVAALVDVTGMSDTWVYERLRRAATAGRAERAAASAHWRLADPNSRTV